MRILFVSRWYPPHTGGVSTHVDRLSGELARLGHDITVLTLDPRPELPERERRGRVRVVRTSGVGPWPDDIAEPTRTLVTELQWTSGLIAAGIRLGGFDIVHGHDSRAIPAAVTLARELGGSLVLTKHASIWSKTAGRAADPARDQIYRFVQRTDHWGYQRADRVIAVSEAMREDIAPSGALGKVSVIPNGTDLLRRTVDRVVFPDGGGEVRLVYAGRLSMEKGVDVALRAFRELSAVRARLTIAGDGPERSALIALAVELGVEDRVEFVGGVEPIRLGAIYAESDIALVPSRWDAGPIAVYEAQASGCLVVASEVGGIPDQIVDGHTGILVAPDDPAALASAVERAACEVEESRRIASRARSTTRARTWSSVAERTLAVYREALGCSTAR